MARKKQGDNSRLDESLGERNKGKKKQSMASRRKESEGTEKSMGRRKFAAVLWTKVIAKAKQKEWLT